MYVTYKKEECVFNKFIKKFCCLVLVFFAPIVSAQSLEIEVRETLGKYSDFPKQGVDFFDISPVLQDPILFSRIIDNYAERYGNRNVDVIMGLDARGFIFGSALAYRLKLPFMMARKPGKLPGSTVSADFTKEYGKDSLSIQQGTIKPGDRVLIVDDLIATGGTATAAKELIVAAGGVPVELCSLVELKSVLAANKSFDLPIYSLLQD